MNLHIRALDEQVDRQDFDCGTPALNEWLKKQAKQSVEKLLASVWVASSAERPTKVVGYYSLAPYQMAFEECPEALRKKLPKYPIHVTLVARLAVSILFQRQGIGGILLSDAFQRSWNAAKTIPVQAVLVQAKDDRAAQFYKAHGLLPFPNEPLHLYMPIASIGQLIQ
jgi:GNAT superfamily N-acetyltransferase